jgi:hypothetical protein
MPLITRQAKGSKLTILEMDSNLEYLETSGYTKYVVSIPSSSILNPLNTPIEIIPDALTTSSLYIIDTLSSYIEYEFNTTAYTLSFGQGSFQPNIVIGYVDFVNEQSWPLVYSDGLLLQQQYNAIAPIVSSAEGYVSVPLTGTGSLVLQLPGLDVETSGDGSLRVVVYAKQIIFGL